MACQCESYKQLIRAPKKNLDILNSGGLRLASFLERPSRKWHPKIPPILPLPKGGDHYSPLEKRGGGRGFRGSWVPSGHGALAKTKPR